MCIGVFDPGKLLLQAASFCTRELFCPIFNPETAVAVLIKLMAFKRHISDTRL
jgi:hypothetical protein